MSDLIKALVIAVILLCCAYALLRAGGELPDRNNNNNNNNDTENNEENERDNNILAQVQKKADASLPLPSDTFSMAPIDDTGPKRDFDGESPAPYPVTSGPPELGVYPETMLHPTNTGEVKLMGTFDSFPWRQIPATVKEFNIKVEAYIGPQRKPDSFTIIGAGDNKKGWALKVVNYQMCLYFNGNVNEIGTLPVPPAPSPMGALVVDMKFRFSQEQYSLVTTTRVTRNTPITTDSIGSANLTGIQSYNTRMFQGDNISAVTVTVTWNTAPTSSVNF